MEMLLSASKSRLFQSLSYSKFLYYRRLFSATSEEITPKITRRIYSPNPEKIRQKQAKKIEESARALKLEIKETRTNELNMQMISTAIYKQVFGTLGSRDESKNHDLIDVCLHDLHKYEMKPEETDEFLKEVDFKLPKLKGADLEEHFYNIGTEQAKPYRDLIMDILKGIPDAPQEWKMQEGWTRYVPGKEPVAVPFPEEDALIFDVEVCVPVGQGPVLATAVSSKAWYGWVSRLLLEDVSDKPTLKHEYALQDLIPLESDPKEKKRWNGKVDMKPKVVIGHNVSFDRYCVYNWVEEERSHEKMV